MRHVLLLRGINLGPNRRVPMAELRALLTEAGYEDVATYVQSGNIVLTSAEPTAVIEPAVSGLISERFGFAVPVVGRTRADLARVVRADPLGQTVDNPKRYQVSFLAEELTGTVANRVRETAVEPERVEIRGREIYAWTPAGVARSKLWNLLAGSSLGVTATARNWTTLLALLELAAG